MNDIVDTMPREDPVSVYARIVALPNTPGAPIGSETQVGEIKLPDRYRMFKASLDGHEEPFAVVADRFGNNYWTIDSSGRMTEHTFHQLKRVEGAGLSLTMRAAKRHVDSLL